MKGGKFTPIFFGFLLFFLTNTLTVGVSIAVFVATNRATGGDTGALALVTLLTVIGFAALYSLIDVFRRKNMIDKPVEEILSATDRISEGDFDVRLEITHGIASYDDFDLIKENLNKMAGELSRSEILKNDFLSGVSHEIKTPLAVIRSYVKLLSRTDDPDLRVEYAHTVINATEKLGNLVGNILKLSRLENNEITPDLSDVKLHESIAAAVIAFEDRIEEKEIELECDLEELWTYSSDSYLDIIWNNLLSNAIKFTPKGGRISVSLKQSGRDAVVEVSDTGVGISPEVGARIFDKFYQADESHATEGNGLGLALVKKVISILGGEISVRSTPGVGSAFTVRLRDVYVKENN